MVRRKGRHRPRRDRRKKNERENVQVPWEADVAEAMSQMEQLLAVAEPYDGLFYEGQDDAERNDVMRQLDAAGVFSKEWYEAASVVLDQIAEKEYQNSTTLVKAGKRQAAQGYRKYLNSRVGEFQQGAKQKGTLSTLFARELVNRVSSSMVRTGVMANVNPMQKPLRYMWRQLEALEQQPDGNRRPIASMRLLIAGEMMRHGARIPQNLEAMREKADDVFELVRDEVLAVQPPGSSLGIVWNRASGVPMKMSIRFSKKRDDFYFGQILFKTAYGEPIAAGNISRFTGEICGPGNVLLPAVEELGGREMYETIHGVVWRMIEQAIDQGRIYEVDPGSEVESTEPEQSDIEIDAPVTRSIEEVDMEEMANERSFKERLHIALAEVPNTDIDLPEVPRKTMFRALRACGAEIKHGGSHWIAECNGQTHSVGGNNDTVFPNILTEIVDHLRIPRADFVMNLKSRKGKELRKQLARQYGVE